MYVTKRRISMIWMIVFLVSMVSGMYMVITNTNEVYNWLFFLPIAYGVMAIPCAKLFSLSPKSKVLLILVGGFFVKMVVAPVLFAMGGYKSFFVNCISIDNMNNAVLYIIYEYVLIFLISNLSLRNRRFDLFNEINTECNAGSRRLLFWVGLISLFIAFAYSYIPEIQKIYLFITDYRIDDLVEIRWDNETIVARGSIQRYIYSLFMFLWPLVRFLLPAVLIRVNYQKRGTTKIGLLLSTLTLIIPFLLIGGDNLAPFIAAMFAIIVIVKLYGKMGRKIAMFFTIVGSVVFLGMIAGKLEALSSWRGATGITNLAQMLNSYIPGFDNTAIAISMQGDNKFETFLLDIISGIPFIGSFINITGDTLNDLFIVTAKTGGQIVPWGCGIGYYFSYIISPLFSAAFVWFLLYREEISNKADDFWIYYSNMLFVVYSAFSMIIYSTQIYLRFIWNVMIPIITIIAISRAKERKHSKNV